MIEMISKLIAGILGLIKKGELDPASQAIEQAYLDFLKEDASFFRSIPKEDLTQKLLYKHNYTNGHLEVLSELFYAQAELFYAKGKTAESLEFYEKSLILFEFIVNENKTYSDEKFSRISLIKEKIRELKI